MDKQQAQRIIRETFESSFDKVKFTGLIKNLLNRIDESKAFHARGDVKEMFRNVVKTYERIGTYKDPNDEKIDILIVYLQKGYSLDHARVTQRNFAGRYLADRGNKKAGLFAFISPEESDWRFSLVKMDYSFGKTKTGKTKVKEKFTPARRWSFLVGENEKSHTAQSRLVKILANDEQAPPLKEIEKAFDIETVTKEFFLEYRELFLRTKEELDRVVEKDPKIRVDFEAKGVDTVNFAKKLLGQIIFLYFLQKKGWFGVGRDDDWGTGSKHFLRELFKKKQENKNFFNDILEPLFYDALRRDRSDDDGYYKLFNCKIPFLNGGLFDPIGGNGGYSWVYTDILLPDELFSNNVITNKGDKGTGILDVFDRYNFTVKEDEPLEKEVAIDPELLGKAYEKFNAIRPDNFNEFRKALKSGRKGEENRFNKKFGVYYTPREIVHYMCQQSLINYLSTGVAQVSSLSIPKKDIETLIHIGEHLIENEEIALIKEQSIKDGKQKTSGYKLKLPENIRKNAKLIDDKLADITVCDPAVGSGAFPVGMMSEIVRARNVLSKHLEDNNLTVYDYKRHSIEHSLYGVDIDPGAVEIAKLRLWLSLIVDEDDIKNIRPLPNLDYKIMQGNSLISEFMGINFNYDKNKEIYNLSFKDETDVLIELFQQKKDEFLNESNVSLKTKLKEEIKDLIVEIFKTKLRIQKNRLKEIEEKKASCSNKEQWKEYVNLKKKKLYKESGFDLELAEKQLKEFTSGKQIKPFFLWNLYFSEVFHDKSGFDVVIANPPYGADIPEEQLRKIKKQLRNTRNSNSAAIFIDFAKNDFTHNRGIVAFIVPKSLLYSEKWYSLAESLLTNTSILIDVEKGFENVLLEQVVFIFCRAQSVNEYQALKFDKNKFIKKTIIPVSSVKHFKAWLCDVSKGEIEIAEKMTKDSLFLSEISFTTRGLPLQSKLKESGDIPVIGGKDIQCYSVVGTKGFVQKEDILIYEKKYKSLLRPKILSQNIVAHIENPTPHIRITSAIDIRGDVLSVDTVNNTFINDEDFPLLFVLAILNSKLISWYAYRFIYGSAIRTMHFDDHYIGKIPIPKQSGTEKHQLISNVDLILSLIKLDDYLQNPKKQFKVKVLEAEINQLIYKLYDLTLEEIKIVEGENE